MPAIRFFRENINFRLKNSLKVQEWILGVAKKEKHTVQNLHYIFCTDQALLERNIQFLKHNTFTDIITFDLSEKETSIIGEIYISVDRIKENALKFEQTQEQELHRVMIHGVLHLCGYGDKTKTEKEEMRRLENHYLKKRNWLGL
jgi:probable rRNA maturation factor